MLKAIKFCWENQQQYVWIESTFPGKGFKMKKNVLSVQADAAVLFNYVWPGNCVYTSFLKGDFKGKR